jgi:hypothetical protein
MEQEPISNSLSQPGRSFLPARGWLLCLLLIALAVAPRLALAASLVAALDRDTVYLGENATLTLTFKDANPGGPPGLPAIAGVALAYQGQASNFGFTNGQASQSVVFTYALTPRQVGELTIPGLSVKVGGTTLASHPLKLSVQRPAPVTADVQAQARQLAFLRLVVPKAEMYAGESVLAEMQLYLRAGVQQITDFQIADFPTDGFSAGKQVQGPVRQTTVGGVAFSVLPLVFPLTALKPGEWNLGPVAASVTAHLPANRGGDPFAGFFNRTVPQRVALAGAAVKIQILPLPTEGRPGDFTGAVGQFTLQASAGPTNVAVGDPVTVKAALSGQGMIDQLALPDFGAWRDFKVYPPTTKVDAPETSFGLRGTKFFEVIATPQNLEVKELPAISFSYFDPATRRYQSLQQPPVPLTVRPAGASPPPSVALPGLGQAKEQPVPSDIVPLKQRLGRPVPVAPPLVFQPWFLGLQLVPVAAWLAALGWRKRAEALARNPRLRRRREVDQWLRARLPELQQHATAEKSDEFFGLLFRMLQERLGERLDLPASAITEAVVADQLAARGLPSAGRDALHDLFQRCNEARYAPVRDSQELRSLIPKLEAALRDVATLKP